MTRTRTLDVTAAHSMWTPIRSGFSLLLVLFALSLVGATLLAIGAHFRFTVKHAQSARLEAQAAQILHSGLAWARQHPSDLPSGPDAAPILLDADALGGPTGTAALSISWDDAAKALRMTVRLTRGPHRITQSTHFVRQTPESIAPDSR